MEYLTEEQVRSVLTYEALLPAVERALIDLSAGRIQQPVRSILSIPEHGGRFALMPAIDGDLMGVKLVTVYEGNRTAAHASGCHSAALRAHRRAARRDGRPPHHRNAHRRRLRPRDPPAGPSRCAGRSRSSAAASRRAPICAHLRMVRSFRAGPRLEPYPGKRPPLRRGIRRHGLRDTAEAAVRGADVVVSVSSVSEPIVRGAWLGEQTLVCAVGAVGPHMRELDDEAMRAAIVVESREAAQRESGDLIGSGANVYAELGELLAGTTQTHTTRPSSNLWESPRKIWPQPRSSGSNGRSKAKGIAHGEGRSSLVQLTYVRQLW